MFKTLKMIMQKLSITIICMLIHHVQNMDAWLVGNEIIVLINLEKW